jgi:hypothetical protein
MTMTPQERDVIAGIFDRLKQAANQPRDPEAEKLIADRLRDQPYAPYAMAQTVYVQEQALLNMQDQLQQLQAQVHQLQSQPAQGGGFLSGLFGGGRPAAPAAPAPMQRPMGQPGMGQPGMGQPGMGQPGMGMMANQQPQGGPPGPWGGQQPQRAGGGFLAGAAMTAAGVAGGMVLGNMLMNAFSGPQGQTAGGGESAEAAPAAADAGAADSGAAMQPASYEDPGMFDDGGGSDEWA